MKLLDTDIVVTSRQPTTKGHWPRYGAREGLNDMKDAELQDMLNRTQQAGIATGYEDSAHIVMNHALAKFRDGEDSAAIILRGIATDLFEKSEQRRKES